MIFGFGKKDSAQEQVENFAQVQLKESNGKYCIQFEFKGVFTDSLAKKLIVDWEKIFLENPEKEFCLVCLCHQMKDYEPLARIKFQEMLKKYKKQIVKIWIVTPSKVIKYGGLILGALSSTPLQVVEREEEITF